jgi:regulator of protease activity HflC (stomatin/prohibitin superfamily)
MRKLTIPTLAILALTLIMGTGCRKPFETPEYKNVSTSQTAYLIPLEGASKKQVKLDSAAAFDKLKVMKKRIQITKRWIDTGRRGLWGIGKWNGKYIPTVDLITVERTPVTCEWTADPASGTSKKNQAIWAESEDSIEFSSGFNTTGYIKEEDASIFLYFYKANSLASVMDQEVRNKIQEVVSEFAAGYKLDILRSKKKEMISKIREIVIPFFAKRGITITTIGMFGGFEYKNKEIQKSIDDVFVAQQLKNVEAAQLAAMDDKKKRMKAEGEAEADKIEQIAEGKANAKKKDAQAIADALLMKAQAEAKSIQLVTEALKEAQRNPMFLEIKKLEVESQRILKWNGTVPYMQMGASSNIVPMLQLPKK